MRRVILGAAAAVMAAVSATGVSTAADDDPVAVTVGGATLRVSQVERRLARVPAYQLEALGATPEEARRHFVESVLVPELLYGEAARDRNLDHAPWLRSRVREVYHRALRDRLDAESTKAAPVTDDEVRAYYEVHRSEFQSEERLLLWRILVDDEALARRILTEARGAGGPERWKNLARQHSRDVSTHLRAGELGFVAPDGNTDVPQVRVDAALYAAARQVKDGDLVGEPVREGPHYAVVWRRGTRPASARSVEDARAFIIELLERKRAFAAFTELLDTLRKSKVSDHHPELLSSLPAEAPGDLQPSRMMTGASVAPSAPAARSADPIPRTAGSVLR